MGLVSIVWTYGRTSSGSGSMQNCVPVQCMGKAYPKTNVNKESTGGHKSAPASARPPAARAPEESMTAPTAEAAMVLFTDIVMDPVHPSHNFDHTMTDSNLNFGALGSPLYSKKQGTRLELQTTTVFTRCTGHSVSV